MARSSRNSRAGQVVGAWGEQAAADYIDQLGWQLVAQNWRCQWGEADLIALEPVPDDAPIGVIIEVKSRTGLGYGHPLESITWAKQARLHKLAWQWRRGFSGRLSGLRVDAIGLVKKPGMAAELTHLRGIR